MITETPAREAAVQLEAAAAARKCWPCGCLHGSLAALERTLPDEARPPALTAAIAAARARLEPVRYECLGCAICHPAEALNALQSQDGEKPAGADACPTAPVEVRTGWPPLPGAYTVLRYQAPVAVCTLTDVALAAAVIRGAGPDVVIVGELQTENLGIERLISNVLANPHIRFLVLCGEDSLQAIGHLPGQSLVSLAREGLDARGRIIGARGKRPVIRNVSREAIEHFRRTVKVVDLVGQTHLLTIMAALRACADQDPGPAEPFPAVPVVVPVKGYVPEKMISDPAGYFVVYVDRRQRRLSLEHYEPNGVLDAVVEGRTAAEVYTPAIERGLLSRLDHAAYLGRELARAERACLAGEPYVQDAAPEGPQPGASAVGGACASPGCCGTSPLGGT